MRTRVVFRPIVRGVDFGGFNQQSLCYIDVGSGGENNGWGRSSIGASNLAQESAPLQYWAYERKFNFFKVDHWPEIKLLYHYKNHIIRGPPLFGKSHSQNF